MMNYKNSMGYLASAAVMVSAIGFTAMTATAQDETPAKKPVVTERTSGRDPFKKYVPAVKVSKAPPVPTKLDPPAIQVRIDRYRAQKLAAANAHVAPPKPTSVLLLKEMQVIGIFRTPRGFAAMVEATPIKLSYVIYPGESFFDGQLVAIEETRLVFRREIVWSDGRRERTVEIKSLRTPTLVESMTSAKAAPANAPAPETEKPTAPEKQ